MTAQDGARPEGDDAGAADPRDSVDPVGSVAEETARLVEALMSRGGPSTAGPAQCTCAEQSCRMCPVCQAIDLVRLVSPAAIAHLAALADAAARALRDLSESVRASNESDDAGPTPDPREGSAVDGDERP